MSWSIMGVFVSKDNETGELKVLYHSWLDKLKILNVRAYSIDFEDCVYECSVDFDKKIFTEALSDKEAEYQWTVFGASSFDELSRKLDDRKNEQLKRKNQLELIRSSVDYYKLTEEEAERLDSDLMYINDDLQDIEYKIDACAFIRHTFELFDEYNKTIYCAMAAL